MKKQFILNPIFIISLFVLLLNDFVLKAQFGNFFTSKLSDLVGIIVFALFLSVFFSKQKILVYGFVVLFFAFWKSPLSNSTIEFINQFSSLNYVRVIDYTDLYCLFILIPLYFVKFKEQTFTFSKKLIYNTLFLTGIFAMVATTRGNMRDYGYVSVGKEFTIKTSKANFLSLLNQKGIEYKLLSKHDIKGHIIDQYELKKFVINSDTIYSANISLKQKNNRKITVYVKNIYITERGKPLVTRDYSKADSIEKVFRENSYNYFKDLYSKK